MQLDPSETRSVWWKGALIGAAKGLAFGLAIGASCALLMQFAIVPLLASSIPGFASTFAPFLTLTPAAATGGIIPTAAFSMIPFAAFSGIISAVTGLFTGGSTAVGAYHQQKHNQRDEEKLIELDGRTHALEQTIAPARHVQHILTQGPRNAANFEQAETTRSSEASRSPTIH